MHGEYEVKYDSGALQYVLKIDDVSVENNIIFNANREYIDAAIAMVSASYEYAEYDAAKDEYTVSETVNTSYELGEG